MKKIDWKRGALNHLILYSLDLAAAIAGWTIGFGFTVKNWPALLFFCLVLRFVFHISHQAYYFHLGKQMAAEAGTDEDSTK